MPAVSVIVPFYNVSAFLERCLGSIAGQSFPDWEAICVDDGSTDGSAQIADRFAAADSRFKVIHKSNGGVSAARNSALELAGGDYLVFCDSDDFLHPQALEIGVHFARKDSSDLVAWTYNRWFRTRYAIRHALGIPDSAKQRYKSYNIEGIPSLCTDDIFAYASEYSSPRGVNPRWAVKHCQPWRCMYRAAAVRGLLFPEGIIYEDFPWWSSVMLRVKRATIVNLPLYFYYPNKGSYILSSKQQFRIESLKKAIALAKAVFENGAAPEQKRAWEEQFLAPFEAKLQKKIERYQK